MELAADSLNNRPNAPWLWRLIATGLSFALFGFGGLCLRLVIFPLLGLLPGDATRRRLRARQTVSRLFWLFVQFMYRSGVLTYEVEGAERLGRPGQLVIANHPSLTIPSPAVRSAPRSTSVTMAAPKCSTTPLQHCSKARR